MCQNNTQTNKKGQHHDYYDNVLEYSDFFMAATCDIVSCFGLFRHLVPYCRHISAKQYQSTFGRLSGAHQSLAAFMLIQMNSTNRAIAQEFILIKPNLPSVNINTE